MGPEVEQFCKDVLSGATVSTKSNGVTRQQLREYIEAKGLLPYVCSECNCEPTHNGKPLKFQLDHKDGDPTNNVQDNLRWLCPNCHSQTETFAGRNSKGKRVRHFSVCTHCKKEYVRRTKKLQKFCSPVCSGQAKAKADWKSMDIDAAIKEHGIRNLEKMWNVSNVAIYKQRDRQRGLTK